MKRKFVAVLMTLAMGLAIPGCSSGTESVSKESSSTETGASTESKETGGNGPERISKKVIEPSFFLYADNYTGQEEVFKTIEKYTNIKFKVIPVPPSSYNEKLSTTIASGNIPDLMGCRSSSTVDKYGPEGAFAKFDPYIEKGLMPDYVKVLEDNPPAMQLVKSPDGSIYGAPRIYDVDYRVDQMWLARVDILEKHGLTTTPETFDELYDVMKQLKELYPDSTPYFNRWGIGHVISGQTHFRNTSSQYFLNQETDQYEYGPYSQAYKDSLEFLARAYKDGILNPDFATITDAEVDELLVANKAFITFDYPHWGDDIVRKVGKENLPEGMKFNSILQPSYNGKTQGTPVLSGYYGYTKAVAAGSKYEEELIQFLNWTYSEEGVNALMYGIEGETYELTDQGKVNFLQDLQTSANPNGTIKGHGLNDQNIFSVMDPLAQETYEMGGENLRISTEFIDSHDGFGKAVFGAKFYSEEDRKRYNDIMTPINTYVEEASMKVILGQMNLDQWDTEVIPAVEKMGVVEAGELINKAYKETFDK